MASAALEAAPGELMTMRPSASSRGKSRRYIPGAAALLVLSMILLLFKSLEKSKNDA